MRSAWPGLAVLGLAVISGCSDNPSTSVRAGDRVSPGVPLIGCKSPELARSIIGMAAARDLEAYQKAALQHGTTGECGIVEPNRVYFVVDAPLSGYLVKVRQEGQTAELWTERGILKKR